MKRLIISLQIFITAAFASVINVPADQPTIQGGIDAASEHDTVLVSPGTYVENINFNGKNLVLGSLFLATGDTSYISQTVIDGNQSGSAVIISDGVDSSTVLVGFTITNGLADFGGGLNINNNSRPKISNVMITGNNNESTDFYMNSSGAGIYCSNSSPTLTDITITNNGRLTGDYRSSNGGGIYCTNSSPTLTDITITNNGRATGDFSSSFGGGIYCTNSSPSLENVTVSDNLATSGGGIYLGSHSNPLLINVWISDNSANDDKGGGIYCTNSSPILENVTINGNRAMWVSGGGIYCTSGSSPTLTNVTIRDNRAYNGGGIHLGSGSPSFTNVTIRNNRATPGHGGGISLFSSSATFTNVNIIFNSTEEPDFGSGISSSGTSSPTFVNCIVWGNLWENNANSVTVTYSDIQGGWEGEGNIVSNPLFVDPNNDDFTLQEGSPCIDAGTAYFVWGGDTLVNMSEDEYAGNAPDMGAFESPYTVSIGDEQILPNKFTLHQNYPNPFNPVTTIRYNLPENSFVNITIYDLLGREVRTLVNQTQDAGYKSVVWDATNDYGKPVSAGVYLYRIQVYDPDGIGAEDFVQVKKMVLSK